MRVTDGQTGESCGRKRRRRPQIASGRKLFWCDGFRSGNRGPRWICSARQTSPGWETPWFPPISAKFPKCPVDVLNFDFGEERVETLAPGVFIFDQPRLEQTPQAKSVPHMQHGVTMR